MAHVKFTTDNLEAEVPDGTEMRDPCENSFNIPFGCKDGICGTCRIRVEDGGENLSPKNEKEEDLLPNKPDERLACQCKIISGEATINDGYD
jgi:ferredoxin